MQSNRANIGEGYSSLRAWRTFFTSRWKAIFITHTTRYALFSYKQIVLLYYLIIGNSECILKLLFIFLDLLPQIGIHSYTARIGGKPLLEPFGTSFLYSIGMFYTSCNCRKLWIWTNSIYFYFLILFQLAFSSCIARKRIVWSYE